MNFGGKGIQLSDNSEPPTKRQKGIAGGRRKKRNTTVKIWGLEAISKTTDGGEGERFASKKKLFTVL